MKSFYICSKGLLNYSDKGNGSMSKSFEEIEVSRESCATAAVSGRTG